MEYLVFLKIGGGLLLAVISAIVFWKKKGEIKIDKPKEMEDGNFAIPKPEDEYMEGIQHDGIITDPKFKVNERPPDPKGKPTIRP